MEKNRTYLEENCFNCKNALACITGDLPNDSNIVTEWFVRHSFKLFFAFSLLTMALAFFLLLNKRFRKHPYKLVAATLFVGAALYQAFAAQSVWCKIDIAKVMRLQLFMPASGFYSQMYWINRFLKNWWRVQVLTFQVANVLINGALFLDLYLIMRNPFYPRSSRERKYYIFIIVYSCIHMGITAYQV